MLRNLAMLAALVCPFGACTSSLTPNGGSAALEPTNPAPTFHGWFAGTMDAALAAARQEQKPVFLYWGAVWCPPCNELKAHVFSQPRFATLMEAVVPVYLDGDSPQAQLWADRLKVSGYPTLVLLDKDLHEVTRFTEGVGIDELADALGAALAGSRPLSEALARAAGGQGDDRDWKLIAYFDWEDPHALGLAPAPALATLQRLTDAAPASLPVERAQLAANLLAKAAASADDAAGDQALTAALAAVRIRGPQYISMMLASQATILATRATLLYSPKDIGAWLFPSLPATERQAIQDRWLKAAAAVGTDPTLSTLNRLWLPWPELAFWVMAHPQANVPLALQHKVQASVSAADQEARGRENRHAVIDDAAGLLADAGDLAGARRLLVAEAEHSDTPWYYQASMADLELKHGTGVEALVWSARAKASAKGAATRLQWIAFDASMTAKVKDLSEASRKGRLLGDAREYYEGALTLPDGFSGRNSVRAERLAGILGAKVGANDVRALIARYAPGCAKLTGATEEKCTQHFQHLATLAARPGA